MQKGFTLIETLFYIFFLSLIIGGTLGAAYGIIENTDRMSHSITTVEEANFLMRKIEWALTGASTVSLPAGGASGSTLRLTKSGYASNPIEFVRTGTDLTIKKGIASPVVLNGNGTILSSVSFQHLTNPEGVRASFSVNGSPFSTIMYLRL